MSFDLAQPSVVAAVDLTPAAGAVLRIARQLGGRLGLGVEIVHVGDEEPTELAAVLDVPGSAVHRLEGEPIEVLAEVLAYPHARIGVLGCRDRAGGSAPSAPFGHVALALIQRVPRPLVAVPPGSAFDAHGRLEKVLLPLDGTVETARSLRPVLQLLRTSGLEIVVTHVFGPDRAPPFLDHPLHELQAWGREFLARHAETDLELIVTSGGAATNLPEVARQQHVDLVAVGWSQDFGPGRAEVIRQLLSTTEIPLLLVPLDGAG